MRRKWFPRQGTGNARGRTETTRGTRTKSGIHCRSHVIRNRIRVVGSDAFKTPTCLLERVMGIEPTSSAWKAEVLPLNYTREALCRHSSTDPDRIRPDSHALVEGVGFEPTKAEPPDLQSGPFGRSGTPPRCKRCIFFDRRKRVKLDLSRIDQNRTVDDSTKHVVRATSNPWRHATVYRVTVREGERSADR